MAQMSSGLAPGLPTASPASPALVAQRGHESIEGLRSMWSGASAPLLPVRGQWWLDTSGAGPVYPVKVYDGAAWVSLSEYLGVSAALAERLRVDAAQSLTAPKLAQGRANLALGDLALLDEIDAALITLGTINPARLPPDAILPPGGGIGAPAAIPAGFVEARGGVASRAANPFLFAAYGTRFGVGDGSTTFGLPFLDMSPMAVVSGNLPQAIGQHTATVLSNGRVMIAGGTIDGTTPLNTVRFGTVSGTTITWATATSLSVPTRLHTTTLLPDGRIMVIGGANNTSVLATVRFGTISGNTITWATGTALPVATRSHTTTLLPDGRIMVVGGVTTAVTSNVHFGTISGDTITWEAGTALPVATTEHKTILLPDGRIMVAGGTTGAWTAAVHLGTISGNTITWTAGTASLASGPMPALVLLPDGRVMVLAPGVTSFVIFGVVSGNSIEWTFGARLPSSGGISDQAATLLDDGRVIVCESPLGILFLYTAPPALAAY